MKKVVVHSDQDKGIINPELHSHFIEFLGSCIYDGIWVGEESEIPNYGGLRKDVVDAMKELEPPVIRWPGGCYADTYHWKKGIGSRKERPVIYNENFGTFERDMNQFGTHEFMELCRMTGAKPWLNVNMMSGSVEEMREWMEYCNRGEETELSLRREANGSREAFLVEYWGIGNEVWGGGGTMTAEGYAAEYRKYATAVPTFSKPGEFGKGYMKRIACGPDGNKPRERVRWTEDFFRALSEYRMPPIEGYDLHFYNWNLNPLEESEVEFGEEEWNQVIRGALELEVVIREQYTLLQKCLAEIPQGEDFFTGKEKEADLIVGEWGNWHGASFKSRPALYQQCTMRDGVTTALTLDIFHHNCDKVQMACVAQSINVLNSLILTDGSKCIRTPNYDVFHMYKVHRGARALVVTEDSGDDVYVFCSEKDGVINVNLVNAAYSGYREVHLDLQMETVCIQSFMLKGDEPTACNTFDNPDRVRAGETEFPVGSGNSYNISLPAASVSVFRFRIR